jgi:hypothetical protein
VSRVNLLLAQLTETDINIPKTALTQGRIKDGLEIFFSVIGAVALVIIVLGAFQYTLSRGDPKAIAKSKNTIIYAVVGLIVAISGYAIVSFTMRNI